MTFLPLLWPYFWQGAIHKQRRQFRGGRGGQIDDMGQYEGGRCQRKSDIVNSRLTDLDFLSSN